ncbi:Uncharacterised protein [Mycobacteroides abscessus subsp. massiliense]|nr:Uncharacterised protein [Mycobacteroides abscessus subsp. massiliense]
MFGISLSQVWDRRQQGPGVRFGWFSEKLFHRRYFDDLPLFHDDDSVRDIGHHTHVVGDEHDRTADPVTQISEEFQDFGLHRHVQGGGRFIGDDDRGVTRDGDRDDHALFLATGELMRIAVVTTLRIGQLYKLQ